MGRGFSRMGERGFQDRGQRGGMGDGTRIFADGGTRILADFRTGDRGEMKTVNKGDTMTHVCDIDKRESCFDPGAMMEKVLGLPGQLEQAGSIAGGIQIPSFTPKNILLLGMGGSAIGGCLLRAQLRAELPVPFDISQTYDIPASINSDSLVIAVSYSGNTEETLSAFEQARERRARLVCISSGGTLREKSESLGIPCIPVPTGYPPRSALGFLYRSILSVLEKAGIIQSREQELAETLNLLKNLRDQWNPDVPLSNNRAKECAQRLEGKIPLLFASGELTAAAAQRWKCQFNENSKSLCYVTVFPELNHNEIVGWSSSWIDYGKFHVMVLRDRSDSPRIATRISFTREVAGKNTGTEELWTRGESPMARLMSLIFFGDLVSVYLAYLYGVDPTEIRVINEMKELLQKEG